jgi:chemotaxis protein MotA
MQTDFLNHKAIRLIGSLTIAGLFLETTTMLAQWAAGSTFGGLFRVFGGGDWGISTLKVVMYAAFTYGLLDLWQKQHALRHEFGAFGLGVLPEQDQLVLSPNEVADLKLNVIGLEKRGARYLLLDFVKKAATQYRNDNNIGATIQVLESQFEAAQNQREGDLEIVRYLIQTIPMLGFVGTIVELTAALQHLDAGLDKVRGAMSAAFDATMVALTLTILLTFFYHRHIGDLDVFFGKMKTYVLENLVSRIYVAA